MADPPGIGPRKPRSRRDNLERRGHSTRPGGGTGTRARASRNILKFLPHLLASRPARSPVRIPQQTLLTARSEPFEPRASDGISATRVPCITVVHLLVRMASQTVGFAAPSLADHVLIRLTAASRASWPASMTRLFRQCCPWCDHMLQSSPSSQLTTVGASGTGQWSNRSCFAPLQASSVQYSELGVGTV